MDGDRNTRDGRRKPQLDLQDLGELVASGARVQQPYRPQPEPRERPPRPWGWHFAGWLGPMYGPVPVGHLLLGLIGLYYKLR